MYMRQKRAHQISALLLTLISLSGFVVLFVGSYTNNALLEYIGASMAIFFPVAIPVVITLKY